MWWIVVAIVAVLVPYTWVSLHYRKEARPFEPYSDMKRQANVQRLLTAGFHRITLSAERPADAAFEGSSPAPLASPQPALAGIPAALKDTLIEIPSLPEEIRSVKAPATASTLLPYTVDLDCTVADLGYGLSSAYLYLKDNTLYLLTDCEKLAGDLRSRSQDMPLRLTAPAGSLPVGEYVVVAAGAKSSQQWILTVK